jgi:hypothetical protein
MRIGGDAVMLRSFNHDFANRRDDAGTPPGRG